MENDEFETGGRGVYNHSYQTNEPNEDLIEVLSVDNTERSVKKKKRRTRRTSEQISISDLTQNPFPGNYDENDDVESLELSTKSSRGKRRKSDTVSLLDSMQESVATALDDDSETGSKETKILEGDEDVQSFESGSKSSRVRKQKRDSISVVGSAEGSIATVLEENRFLESDEGVRSFESESKSSRVRKQKRDSISVVGSAEGSIATVLEENRFLESDEGVRSFESESKSSRVRKQKRDSISVVGSAEGSIATVLEDDTEIQVKDKKSHSARKHKRRRTSLPDSPQLSEEQHSSESGRKSMKREQSPLGSPARIEDDPKSARKSSKSKKRLERSTTVLSVISEAIRGLEDDVLDDIHPIPDNVDAVGVELIQSSEPEKVYIQDKRGFRPSTGERLLREASALEGGSGEMDPNDPALSPLELALLLQHGARQFFSFCQGLLGGFALCHICLVLSISDNTQSIINFAEGFAHYCRATQIIYYFLAAVCMVSALDRCDFAHLDLLHFSDLVRFRLADLILILLYFSCLVTTVICTKWDDRFALTPYNAGLWDKPMEARSELLRWRVMSLIRGSLALAAWITVFFGPDDDLFYLHLCSMAKYQGGAGNADAAVPAGAVA